MSTECDPARYAVEPIAIVGMACRVPGAGDVDQFWRNLVDGVESVTWFDRDHQLALGVPVAELDDPAYVPAAQVLGGYVAVDGGFVGLGASVRPVADPWPRQC